MMKVLAATAVLLFPATALGHDKGSIHHRNSFLRSVVIDHLGHRAPGRDIVNDGLANGKEPSRAQVRQYLDTLRRMAFPPPLISAPVAQMTSVPSSGGSVGSCPGVIPGYIIQAESGGNPNARNPSGAFGCYQLMPEHFAPGGACDGMGTDISGQAACASKLWDGGKGVSNWAATA